MTKIDANVAPHATDWVQRSQDRIHSHSAWHGTVSEKESENLLKNQSAFTYLLRAGDKEHSYFISFVKENGTIKHQFFVLELDRKGWYYRNGSTLNSPAEIIEKELSTLIPLMMHCDSRASTPLSKMQKRTSS